MIIIIKCILASYCNTNNFYIASGSGTHITYAEIAQLAVVFDNSFARAVHPVGALVKFPPDGLDTNNPTSSSVPLTAPPPPIAISSVCPSVRLLQSMVTDLIMPVIGLALPGMENLSTLKIPVGTQEFGVGGFLVALITFIIVAFVIFILVKVTKKWGIQ